MTEEFLSPLSILVVDDSDDTVTSTAELLNLNGHSVSVATCGADAIREVKVKRPDVILLDIGMPGMSGWDVARDVRQTLRGRQPIIVAVTGYSSEADRWRSADSGCDLHLVKPLDPAALLRLLAWVQKSFSRKSAPSAGACSRELRSVYRAPSRRN